MPRRRERYARAAEPVDLRDVFDPDKFRKLAGVEDQGLVQLAEVKHPDGDDPVETVETRRALRVWAVDVMTGYPVLATIYAPANALFRKPPVGDRLVLLTGANVGGPGVPRALHGGSDDEDSDNDVPEHFDDGTYDDPCFLSPPTGDVVVESRDKDVHLRAPATGKKVFVNGDTYALPKWNTNAGFEKALSDFLNTLQTELIKGTSGTPAAQQLVGMAAITAAITAFRAALTNGTYDSTEASNG